MYSRGRKDADGQFILYGRLTDLIQITYGGPAQGR